MEKKTLPNDPFHPTDIWVESTNGGFFQEGTDKGITLRQHFAGLAMQSLMGTRTVLSFWQKVKVFLGCELNNGAKLLRLHPDCAAKIAVEHADALISELNKSTQ